MLKMSKKDKLLWVVSLFEFGVCLVVDKLRFSLICISYFLFFCPIQRRISHLRLVSFDKNDLYFIL